MNSGPHHPSHIVAGHSIADRYRLISRIGGGGMGEVWKAEDEVLARTVAVKLLRPEFADDNVFRERLRREARAAGGIGHRGVVPVFDFGEIDRRDAANLSFIVMEFVDGPSLSEEIHQLGVLSPARTMLIVEQAASALQAAHDAGVIHRDVKPGNILVAPDGDVKIADFGIARSADTLSLTRTGTLTGTARYFSPEQAGGLSATAASDIYSLGVVAYACLTGDVPFTVGNDVTIALAHIQQPPPELPAEVPSGVSRLVMSMLAKDPADRPATAGAVAKSARALIHTAPGAGGSHPFPPTAAFDAPTRTTDATQPSPEPTRVAPAQVAVRQRRLPLGAVAAVLVFVLLGAALFGLLRSGGTVVPETVGIQQSVAESRLAKDGLVAKVRTRDIPGKGKGVVIGQSEAAGAQVDDGSTVVLTVATGNVGLPTEKLVGASYDEAAAILKSLGLTPAKATRVSSGSAGSVIAVVPGDKAVNGSTVTLTVAMAPTQQENRGHGKKPGKTGEKGKD